MTVPVDATLLDPDGWHSDPVACVNSWHEALQTISKHDPEVLHLWVAHVLDRLAVTLGRPRSALAAVFVSRALLEDASDVAYSRSLIAAMRRCTLEYFSVGDPIAVVLSEIGDPDDPALTAYMRLRAFSALPILEQQRVLGLER
jgi:hypothetical protein